MSRATFNLELFQAQIFDKSLARTNRFEVIISPPGGLITDRPYDSFGVSLLVEQASLPMLNIATKPFKIFGPSYQRPVTSEYGGEGISLNFHVDRDMRLKRFFDDWMHTVVDPVTYTVGYQSDYIGTIEIRQLDEQDNVTYGVILEEAFPRNMNLIDLNNSASNQTHRLNVLFAYKRWREIGLTNPVEQPRAVKNPQVAAEDYRVPPVRRQWNWSTGELTSNPGSDLPPAA